MTEGDLSPVLFPTVFLEPRTVPCHIAVVQEIFPVNLNTAYTSSYVRSPVIHILDTWRPCKNGSSVICLSTEAFLPNMPGIPSWWQHPVVARRWVQVTWVVASPGPSTCQVVEMCLWQPCLPWILCSVLSPLLPWQHSVREYLQGAALLRALGVDIQLSFLRSGPQEIWWLTGFGVIGMNQNKYKGCCKG